MCCLFILKQQTIVAYQINGQLNNLYVVAGQAEHIQSRYLSQVENLFKGTGVIFYIMERFIKKSVYPNYELDRREIKEYLWNYGSMTQRDESYMLAKQRRPTLTYIRGNVVTTTIDIYDLSCDFLQPCSLLICYTSLFPISEIYLLYDKSNRVVVGLVISTKVEKAKPTQFIVYQFNFLCTKIYHK